MVSSMLLQVPGSSIIEAVYQDPGAVPRPQKYVKQRLNAAQKAIILNTVALQVTQYVGNRASRATAELCSCPSANIWTSALQSGLVPLEDQPLRYIPRRAGLTTAGVRGLCT